MDGQRFDDLVRALGVGASRRQVLRGLATGMGAALLGRAGAGAQQTACPVPLALGEPCLAKVTICHRTGSAATPFVIVDVCAEAVPAHAANHLDVVACPENQIIDFETCACVCDPTLTCEGEQVLDPDTCECRCPAATPQDCGNAECCPATAQCCGTTCCVPGVTECRDGLRCVTTNPGAGICDPTTSNACLPFPSCGPGLTACSCGKLTNGGTICRTTTFDCGNQTCTTNDDCPGDDMFCIALPTDCCGNGKKAVCTRACPGTI